MMTKRSHIISFIVIANILFVGGSFVVAQSVGFTEPNPSEDLAVPLTTSDSPQAINSALGVGFSDDTLIPDEVKLYIQGSSLSKDNTGVEPNIPAQIIADITPKDDTNGSTLSLQGSQLNIGTTNCPNDARVCVIENEHINPAVDVLQDTGIALFGQTAASGKAGVYGKGHYGVYAYASNQASIPIVGQSCTEAQGSPGTCLEYGAAGFFDGDFVVEDGIHDGTGVLKGTLTGDGRNLYRVQSLFNLNDPLSTPESKGIAYKTYGLLAVETVNANSTRNISNILNAGETVTGIYASYKNDGETVYRPSDALAQYDEATNTLILTNNAANLIEVRIVVSYLLPN